MANIKKVEFELESTRPLLMDRYAGNSTAKTESDYKQEAELKIYSDDKGIFIPGAAIKACIREAISELGGKKTGKQNRQMVRAGVFVSNMYLGRKDHDGIVGHLVSRGFGTKLTRVTTFRPIINGWKASGTMNLIGIEPSFVQQALELGGIKYGLLSYRPDYGGFIVKKFLEVKK